MTSTRGTSVNSTYGTTLNNTTPIPKTTVVTSSRQSGNATTPIPRITTDDSHEVEQIAQTTSKVSLSTTTLSPTTDPTTPVLTSTTREPPPSPVFNVTLGCPKGDRKDCDDISGSQCYNSGTRQDCCETCEDLRENIPDCQFGDKIQNCNSDQPWRCYNNNHRSDCCLTCQNAYVDVQGYEYGDKISNCQASECNLQGRKNDCCDTCSTGTTTVTPPGTSSRGSDSPGYIVPVIAAIGGVLLILLVVFVFLWWRRRKQGPENLSPIDEKMYNDYKLTKRAPMALPRDLDQPNKLSLKRSDSEEYAYINPEDVKNSPEDEKRRSGNDPLPPRPNGPVEYLELGNADKYGYLEPLGTFIKNGDTPKSTDTNVQYKETPPDERENRVQYENEQTETHRLNTYQKFPADGSHLSPKHGVDDLQSEKL